MYYFITVTLDNLQQRIIMNNMLLAFLFVTTVRSTALKVSSGRALHPVFNWNTKLVATYTTKTKTKREYVL